MRKFVLLCVFFVCVLTSNASQVFLTATGKEKSAPTRYEVIAWHEDFEGNTSGWTHYDGTAPPNNWHIYNYGGAQGTVWWMGDPDLAQGTNIGGYLSHQYLVLDTPARTLNATNATLTFKMRYCVEDLGVHENYDGWDACNVRISTDGGNSWQIINGTPSYNATSCYSFGHEHGEGPGVPGWGGSLLNWTNATFNLSAYIGQSVKIRFAFASDPAYDTTNNSVMFGMMVDDISFGGYTNNGVNDGQMTWQSLVPLGGDLWHLATDTLAPSPTHIMKCQNAQGSYNPNMLNYLVSPPIQLPNSGDIRADFMIQGEFVDNDTFPNVDYWGWEISIDNGESWRYMSNPYNDPNLSNYVYSDAPNVWASMVDSFSLDGYISDFAGEIIRFRWMFRSDEDQPQGIGIMIDDVKIYNDVYITAPSELVADVQGTNVVLNWIMEGGGGGGDEGWLNYDGENAGNSVGTGSEADFDVAAKWGAAGEHGINPWVGMNITKIKFFPSEANCSYAVRIWTGGAGTLVYNQAVPNPNIGQWNEITLTTPWTIPAGTSIMAGYRCNTQTGHPAGCDEGPVVNGYGNMIRFQGAWSPLTDLSAGLTYNWNIRIYVQDSTGREYEITNLPSNPQNNTGILAVHRDESRRDATSVKIYRNEVQIAEVAGNTFTYTDMNVAEGLHSYHVTAMYGNNESNPSNTASAFILPAMNVELGNDDGSAESGYNVGAARQMAVKYSYHGAVEVRYAKIYVHTVSFQSIIVRVFDNDGPGGLPQTQLAQVLYPAVSVKQGWNYIELPSGIDVDDGQFYIGILEVVNAPSIGLDHSFSGNSYIRTDYTWEPLYSGELMIRAIVYSEEIEPFGDPIILPSSMTVVANTTINGAQASSGDILAAFVDVGGTPQLRGKQTIEVINGIAGCILQVYTETNGELIYFKIWDSNMNILYPCSTTLVSEVNQTVGSWPNDMFIINAISSTAQNIALQSGWNLISLNVSPPNHSIASLISPIANRVLQIKGIEGVYEPGNPYSTLTSLGDGKAYHIYMLSSANWQVQGVQIPPNTPISLNDGWNMAAYFPQTQMSTSTAISSISAWLQQVKGSDGVYIPNNPYNTLDFMAPGKGYWIKISGNHSLIYPSRGSQENGLAGIMRRTELPEVALKPGSAVVLARCDIAEVGDILLARVDNELRGAEALIAPESFPAALIQIYCEEAGEQARFSILKPDGQELPLVTSLELEPGQSYGTQSGFIILEPQSVAADDILALETTLKGSYPNPFNPSTTIKYDVAADNTPVTLTIYNIKGQKVCSLVDARIDKGSHTVVWNGTDDMGREVSSGIYLLKFSANNHNRSMKLLLQK